MMSRCRESRAGRSGLAQPAFTTRTDFVVDVAQVPVIPGRGHGNVIEELIFEPDFLH
jgi:hypothetical protein